jgi:hypothetical protein
MKEIEHWAKQCVRNLSDIYCIDFLDPNEANNEIRSVLSKSDAEFQVDAQSLVLQKSLWNDREFSPLPSVSINMQTNLELFLFLIVNPANIVSNRLEKLKQLNFISKEKVLLECCFYK